jgi:hypothetical protein
MMAQIQNIHTIISRVPTIGSYPDGLWVRLRNRDQVS